MRLKICLEKETFFELSKDIVVSSSSYAAALVAGTMRSGPQSWRNSSGKNLKDIEESLITN